MQPCHRYLLVAAGLLVALGPAGTFEAAWNAVARPAARATVTDYYGDPLPLRCVARMGTLRFWVPDRIESLVFSRCGRFAFAACDPASQGERDPPLTAWEAVTGKLVRKFGDRGVRVTSMALSPDGSTLAMSGSGTVSLWDPATGKLLRRLGDRKVDNSLYTLLFSPDRKTLICTSDIGIQVWDYRKGTRLQILSPASDKGFRSFAFSPDGKTLAATEYLGKEVFLWDIGTGRPRFRFTVGSKASVDFSPDGKVVAAGGEEGQLQVRDAGTGKLLRCWQAWKDRTERWAGGQPLAFSPDGKYLAAAAEGGRVILWAPARGRKVRELEGAYSEVVALAFRPDGKVLACAGENGRVRLLDPERGKPLLPIPAHQDVVCWVGYSPGGSLLSAGFDGSLRSWDARTGRPRRVLYQHPLRGGGLATDLVCAVHGRLIAVAASSHGQVRLLDSACGKEVRVIQTVQRLSDLAFSPNGTTLASAGSDGDISLWNVETGTSKGQLEALGEDVGGNGLHFSPDGRFLALAGPGRAVSVWDVAARKRLPALVGHLEDVEAVAFNPHTGGIVSASQDGTLRLWDALRGRELRRLSLGEDSSSEFSAVAVSPDGRLLASGESGWDGDVVRLWELASGQELCKLTGHQGEIRGLAFSPDGRRVASGGRDQMVLVWDVLGLDGNTRIAKGRLDQKELEQIWQTLGHRDARVAYRAVADMIRSMPAVLPLLRERLTPISPIPADRLGKWVSDLDSADFQVREMASASLATAKDQAEEVLCKVLGERPSAEQKRRVERLLTALRIHEGSAERLREMRALTVLEMATESEARGLLKALASGAPFAWRTREANAALRRLTTLSAPKGSSKLP